MKLVTSSVVLLLFFLALFVCATSLYNFNFYGSMCAGSSNSEATLKEAISSIIPSGNGNCNCTVIYSVGSPLQSVPSISCDCQEKEVLKEVQTTIRREECSKIAAPWYAEGKDWHSPAKFPLCSMDACFNYSRCVGSSEKEELLIYSYDVPSPPLRYFSKIKETKYHTNDPEKACLFLVFLETSSPWPQRPDTLPYWNGGSNHVLVTFADRWEARGPPADSIGYASIMGTIVHETTSRAGFDIGIPLPGRVHMRELQSLKPRERKYLATFRGLRYVGFQGEGTFRSRDSFREMHNGKDVIVATSCNQQINKMAISEHPEFGAHCDEDELVHANYTFNDLMNATFGLVPAGRQPASYRFIEVMSAGAIPVLIADNYVKPFETLIQWHTCLLQFPTSEMHRIVGVLRAMKDDELLKRQERCLQYYNEFLKDDETLFKSSVRALKARFLGAIPNSLGDIMSRR